MYNIEKEAQKKSLTNILKRNLNPMNMFRYFAFDEYQEMYDEITAIDKWMRETAEEKDPDMREAIHQARMAFKNREYPKVMYYAWELVSIMDGIFTYIPRLEGLRDQILKTFHSSTGLTQEQMNKMHEALGADPSSNEPKGQTPLRERAQMPIRASFNPPKKLLYTTAAPEYDLFSEATAAQWLQENLPSMQQMKGNILERMFRNTMGKQKETSRDALRLAEETYKSIKGMFRKLDEARTDFGEYIKIAKSYQDRFENIKKQMSDFYKSNFANIVPQPHQEALQQQLPIQQQVQPVVENSPPPVPPVPEAAIEVTPDGEGQKSASMEILNLIVKAEQAKSSGNNGIAAALYSKASEICDNFGDSENSIKFLISAQNLIK